MSKIIFTFIFFNIRIRQKKLINCIIFYTYLTTSYLSNMEDQLEVFRTNLVSGRDLESDLKVRDNKFIFQTINKKNYPQFEAEGWEISRTNKSTVKIQKPKSHDKFFEDKVWTILAKMGFKYMNSSSPVKLIYTENPEIPGRKLDVFASDEESILIIECKSSIEVKKKDFQTAINDFIVIKNGSYKFVQKIFPNQKKKVKFLFVTNNTILSDIDRERLKTAQIEHLNNDDIAYYEQLVERVGKAGKYQLLGRLFKDQEIPQLECKVPAIRGKMGGYTYYSFSLEPDKLLKIGYILHRTEITGEQDGYQRMVTKTRLKQIEDFLNNEDEPGFFPNSIIINIATPKENPLTFNFLKGESHDSNIAEPVILNLPKKYHSAFIIDGQHRLYGYANTKWKDKNSIPVVAFENLPPEKQVELFVQINSKQKPVPKNLLITIVADLMWNSDKPKEALNSLKSKLFQRLGEKENSPLYKRIIIGENKRDDITCISLDFVMSYGLNKTNFFPKYNRDKLISTGHLWVDTKAGYELMLEKSFLFFKLVFEYIELHAEEQWKKGNSKDGGFITTNIGIVSIIRIVDNILELLPKIWT